MEWKKSTQSKGRQERGEKKLRIRPNSTKEGRYKGTGVSDDIKCNRLNGLIKRLKC